MKGNLKITAAALALTLMVSCSDDGDETSVHEVGSWELANFAFINLPDGYASWEGEVLEVSQLTTITGYQMDIMKDGTYEREIATSGKLPEEDAGSWTNDDGEFTFESDEGGEDEVFGVEKNEDDQLWLSTEFQIGLIPDIVYDTITQDYIDYLNSLSDAEYDSLESTWYQYPLFDLVFVFERQ